MAPNSSEVNFEQVVLLIKIMEATPSLGKRKTSSNCRGGFPFAQIIAFLLTGMETVNFANVQNHHNCFIIFKLDKMIV